VGSFRFANLLALWFKGEREGMRRFFATRSPPSSSQVATKDTCSKVSRYRGTLMASAGPRRYG